MPIRHTIDHARRRVEAVASGEITLGDVETFLDAIVVAEALPHRKLFDARASFGRYTDEELMRLAARISPGRIFLDPAEARLWLDTQADVV